MNPRLYLLVACALLLARLPAAESPFARVAEILEKRCVNCHNDDDRKGQLSLQTAESLRAGGESGAVVTPRDPAASSLLEYITGDDPEMPKDGQPLSEEDVAAIREWIAGGAKWPATRRLENKAFTNFDWWSLQPIQRPNLPQLDEASSLTRTAIDHFILHKLTANGLTLSPEADRRTLIRRLYFDLVGLPPSPEEVASFLNDDAPTAYDDLVDRLLASPQYGERWARHWLDVVKYADTCGYDKDKLRPNAWPYRDYVIRSFNEDKHYTRFVHEQLAGDVLFPGQPDGVLGLGFIAAGPWDFIGHVEVPESKIDGRVARHIDRDEMVTNTFNTFCSVTIQCARCHHHKFDPFTQQDYYGLQTLFAAVDRAERQYDLDPAIEQRRLDLLAQRKDVESRLAALDAELRKAGGEELTSLEKLIGELKEAAKLGERAPEYGYHSSIESQADLEKWVQVDLGRQVAISKIVTRPCADDFGGIGQGFGFPVRFKIAVAVEDSPESKELDNATIVADQTSHDFPNPGLAPHEADAGGVVARYVRFTATKLVEHNRFHLSLAELQVFDADGRSVSQGATVTSLDSIEAPTRWRRSNLTDGLWAKSANEEASRQLAAARGEKADLMRRLHTPQRTEARKKLESQQTTIDKEVATIPTGKMVYAAATNFKTRGNFKPTMGKPREIHVLHRGNIQDPREASTPRPLPIPTVLDDFQLAEQHKEGERRVALARWLTSNRHPLTWRSIVNRVWQYHFGRGIVESPNDFGRMGQLPSHPQLLDWLAAEFRDNGQSIKQLHRLIVTSAVYRQSSRRTADEQALAIDGGNRLLWRMNRRRLTAEEIRDAILSVSDRLDSKMGGPGYYLFVLEKTAHSPHYEYHKFNPADVATHRRSVYRFIVRSQPDPFMTTLDCADSSQSTPLRNETLTSLQALSLLNNKFNLTMAEYFADRLEREGGTPSDQVERAMWLATGRTATDDERTQLVAYATKHGLANLCRLMFNLSEFMYLD